MQVELIAVSFIVLFGSSYGMSTLFLNRNEKIHKSKHNKRIIATSVQRW